MSVNLKGNQMAKCLIENVLIMSHWKTLEFLYLGENINQIFNIISSV